MDLDAGEIYFIREQIGDSYSEYTKIGLVREKTGRTSLDRAKEHQTGNPRSLVPVKVIPTVFVYETETALHREFAHRRLLPGEWFRLDDNELCLAISRCEELATKNRLYIPLYEQAEALAQVPSTTQLLPASEEAQRWQYEHCLAESALDIIAKSLKQYKAFLVDMKARGIAVNDYINVTESAGRHTLDKKRFGELYAELIEQFTTTSVTLKGKFTVVPITDESLASDHRLASIVSATLDLDTAVHRADASENALSQMHERYLTLIGLQPALTKDCSIAEVNLQVLCGENAGIEDVCTWPRSEERAIEIDWKAIKALHPAEYAACMRMGSSSTRVNFVRGGGSESSED
jgi:hypothetical protein